MWGQGPNGGVVTVAAAEGLAGVLVVNLPTDCTEREVKNLGALLPGFHSAEPGIGRGRPGEVTLWFASLKFAKLAVERLQGFQFDSSTQLHASLSVGESSGGKDQGVSRRPATPVELAPVGGPHHAQNGLHNTMANAYYYAPAMMVPNVGSIPPGMVSNVGANMVPPGRHTENWPCNTLFIGNLTVTVTEKELEETFRCAIHACCVSVFVSSCLRVFESSCPRASPVRRRRQSHRRRTDTVAQPVFRICQGQACADKKGDVCLCRVQHG